jgi:hypothetical protein
MFGLRTQELGRDAPGSATYPDSAKPLQNLCYDGVRLAQETPAQSAAATGRREMAALKRRVRALDLIANMNPHRLAVDGTRPTYELGNETKKSFFVNRERKLKGEWIDDGDWHEMMDIATAGDDPEIDTLYQSNEELV